MNTSNFINLIGHLGSDPKIKTFESGTMIAEFSVATKEVYRDRNGVKQERTEWHNIKAFGKLADLFGKYLQRGSKVSIVGSMRYEKWVDKYEQNRVSSVVIADSFSFLDSLKDRDNSNTSNYGKDDHLVASPEKTAPMPSKRFPEPEADPVVVEANADLPF